MKTFLIATDFSAASRNATHYGIALATAFNGRAILASAYQQVPVTVAEPLIFVAPDIREVVIQKLKAEADLLYSENAAPVEILAKEGPNANAILEAAKEMNADLIIAGMKGSGKATRKFFGSTVTSLAKKTTIPIVIIPEGAPYRNPGTIALAEDISAQAGTHLLDALNDLVEKFHSKLYIVLDKNITKTLDHFISTNHVDMLAMIPHKESLPERWFLQNNTREMLLTTNIPLLILPEEPHKGEKHKHSIIF